MQLVNGLSQARGVVGMLIWHKYGIGFGVISVYTASRIRSANMSERHGKTG